MRMHQKNSAKDQTHSPCSSCRDRRLTLLASEVPHTPDSERQAGHPHHCLLSDSQISPPHASDNVIKPLTIIPLQGVVYTKDSVKYRSIFERTYQLIRLLHHCSSREQRKRYNKVSEEEFLLGYVLRRGWRRRRKPSTLGRRVCFKVVKP